MIWSAIDDLKSQRLLPRVYPDAVSVCKHGIRLQIYYYLATDCLLLELGNGKVVAANMDNQLRRGTHRVPFLQAKILVTRYEPSEESDSENFRVYAPSLPIPSFRNLRIIAIDSESNAVPDSSLFPNLRAIVCYAMMAYRVEECAIPAKRRFLDYFRDTYSLSEAPAAAPWIRQIFHDKSRKARLWARVLVYELQEGHESKSEGVEDRMDLEKASKWCQETWVCVDNGRVKSSFYYPSIIEDLDNSDSQIE